MLSFKAGDRVQADLSYINNPASGLLIRTIQLLNLLGSEKASVTNIGYIMVDGQLTTRPLPIHIYPINSSNVLFQNGRGTIVYFNSEEQINNALLKVN